MKQYEFIKGFYKGQNKSIIYSPDDAVWIENTFQHDYQNPGFKNYWTILRNDEYKKFDAEFSNASAFVYEMGDYAILSIRNALAPDTFKTGTIQQLLARYPEISTYVRVTYHDSGEAFIVSKPRFDLIGDRFDITEMPGTYLLKKDYYYTREIYEIQHTDRYNTGREFVGTDGFLHTKWLSGSDAEEIWNIFLGVICKRASFRTAAPDIELPPHLQKHFEIPIIPVETLINCFM